MGLEICNAYDVYKKHRGQIDGDKIQAVLQGLIHFYSPNNQKALKAFLDYLDRMPKVENGEVNSCIDKFKNNRASIDDLRKIIRFYTAVVNFKKAEKSIKIGSIITQDPKPEFTKKTMPDWLCDIFQDDKKVNDENLGKLKKLFSCSYYCNDGFELLERCAYYHSIFKKKNTPEGRLGKILFNEMAMLNYDIDKIKALIGLTLEIAQGIKNGLNFNEDIKKLLTINDDSASPEELLNPESIEGHALGFADELYKKGFLLSRLKAFVSQCQPNFMYGWQGGYHLLRFYNKNSSVKEAIKDKIFSFYQNRWEQTVFMLHLSVLFLECIYNEKKLNISIL